MLIKLSDLLSYMLYECDSPKVNLSKEIMMLKEYISLEEIRQGEKLEMTLQIKGNINGQMISPLLLLPFIDNSFSYTNDKMVEQAWVNLEIIIEENNLSMKLINGMPVYVGEDVQQNEQQLANVQKRLELLYPGKYELKINAKQEMLVVQLNLNLQEEATDNS
jgi:LytS/YehU family sensor histidine kinase